MNQIAITQFEINGAEVNSVNAREIHYSLDVKTKFADWIKRAIDKYDFIENEDYAVLKIGNGNNATIDYIVTLDMAKELSMLENNPKGKEFRKYFIEMEKKAVSTQMAIPSDPMQVLKLMFNAMEQTNAKQIEHDTRIKALEETSSLDSRQQAKIQDEVKSRVKDLIKQHNLDIEAKHILFSRMYSMLKREYNVPSYKDIPTARFEEALLKIQGTRFGGVL